jgi:hypothetical protein
MCKRRELRKWHDNSAGGKEGQKAHTNSNASLVFVAARVSSQPHVRPKCAESQSDSEVIKQKRKLTLERRKGVKPSPGRYRHWPTVSRAIMDGQIVWQMRTNHQNLQETVMVDTNASVL